MKKILLVFSSLMLLLGCSDGTSNGGDESEEADVYLSLREIEVVEDHLLVEVNGEVRTSEDMFYYKVEIGNETIIDEQLYSLESTTVGEWRPFQIHMTLEEEHIQSEDIPFITFYVKDQDEIINPNYVPIDIKDS